MKHLRPNAAPSSTLLKFLRAQNNGQPFFVSNLPHASCPAARPTFRRPVHSEVVPSGRRSIMTQAASPVHLESAVFSLRSFWPERRSAATGGGALRQPCAPWPLSGVKQPQPSDIRSVSSSRKAQGNDRSFWGFGRRPGRQTPQSDDLPGLSNFLDENSAIGRPLRLANELKLRCTEFDEQGNITLENGEFKKSALIAKYGLLPRDLRKIDSSLLPSIMVRPSAILINLLHLRVLIKSNRVLVFDAYGTTDSYTQSLFMHDLESKLRAPETRTPGSNTVGAALPYEFRALEAVLISVTGGLEGEFEGVREPVVQVLRELEEDIDRDQLRHLLIYSKKLSSFEQKARLVRDAIDDLLEADDDLAQMYLTEKAQGIEREDDEHTEIEMLLESYHKVCDEIVQVSGNLVSNIRNTEEIVKAILDANRNSLMLLDLKFTICTLGLGAGTFFAALYGMNLKNFWEENDFAFAGVSIFSAICGVIVCRWGMKKLKGVQKVSMWGQTRGDNTPGRRGWNIVGERHSERLSAAGRKERLRGIREGQMLGDGGHEHLHEQQPPRQR